MSQEVSRLCGTRRTVRMGEVITAADNASVRCAGVLLQTAIFSRHRVSSTRSTHATEGWVGIGYGPPISHGLSRMHDCLLTCPLGCLDICELDTVCLHRTPVDGGLVARHFTNACQHR